MPQPVQVPLRNRWPWVALGVVVVIAIAANGYMTASSETQAPPVPRPATPGALQPAGQQQPTPTGFAYQVIGKQGPKSGFGPDTMITYISSAQMDRTRITDVDLPWSTTVDLGGAPFVPPLVSARAGDGVTSITCRVLEDDNVLADNTSVGRFAVVNCPATEASIRSGSRL